MKKGGVLWSRSLVPFFLVALGLIQAQAEPGELVEIRAKVYTTNPDGSDKLIAEPNLILTMGEWGKYSDQDEITYPVDWTLPSIPVELSGSIKADPSHNTGKAWDTNTQRALIPPQPTKFESRDFGLSLEFRPHLDERGEVTVNCRVDQVFFDGFLNESNPLHYQKGSDPKESLLLLSNRLMQTKFRERKREMVFLPSDEGLVAKTTSETVLPEGSQNLPVLKLTVSANRLDAPEPEPESNDTGNFVFVATKFIEFPSPLPSGSRVFTDREFQVWVRDVNTKSGVDLLSAPSIFLPAGQDGEVEILREFVYPLTYDPPKLLDEAKTKGKGGEFPVTPSTPKEFESRDIGISMGLLPRILSDGRIELQFSPRSTEFVEFLNFGEEIYQLELPVKNKLNKIVLTENRIEMPRFSELGLETKVKLHSGQTVLIGGLVREDIQQVEDKIPVLGDLPIIGKYARAEKELHTKRYIYFAVTATRLENDQEE